MFKVVDSMSFVFNCFCGKPEDEKPSPSNDDDHLTNQIFRLCEKHRISILPVRRSFEVEDLYPSTNQVHTWNIFVIGKDKNYILSTTNCINIENASNLVNNKADGVIPLHFVEFFEPVWDKTLSGSRLQFFMVYEGRTYLVDTYPFQNTTGNVIGACMFMRLFETLPMSMFKNIRLSLDVQSANHNASAPNTNLIKIYSTPSHDTLP